MELFCGTQKGTWIENQVVITLSTVLHIAFWVIFPVYQNEVEV